VFSSGARTNFRLCCWNFYHYFTAALQKLFKKVFGAPDQETIYLFIMFCSPRSLFEFALSLSIFFNFVQAQTTSSKITSLKVLKEENYEGF